MKDICEGESSCVDVCPVDCIKKADGENAKGTGWYLIVAEDCELQRLPEACPVEGAILPDLSPAGPERGPPILKVHRPLPITRYGFVCRDAATLGPRSSTWGYAPFVDCATVKSRLSGLVSHLNA